MVTTRVNSDIPAEQQAMAGGLKILARIIATAHRRRTAEAGNNQRQLEGSGSKKANRGGRL